MRVITLIAGSLVVVVCAGGLVRCKKSNVTATIDPHSAEGVLLKLEEQDRLLNDALGRKDRAYMHDLRNQLGIA